MEEYIISGLGIHEQNHGTTSNPPGPARPPALTDDEAYGDRACASCSAPGCRVWCSGCDIKDLGKIRTFYCSRDCQANHFAEHKVACRARVSFARAASIFFEMFIEFMKATQTDTISKVVEKDGVVTVRNSNRDMRPWTGGSLFLQYPDQVLPDGTPTELMNGVLLRLASNDVFMSARPLLSLFMEQFCTSIEVAAAKPRNISKRTAPTLAHAVLKIRVGDSEIYALDATGAQYGWTDVLYHWDTFTEYRFQGPVEVQSLLRADRADFTHLGMDPLNTINGAQAVLRQIVAARCRAQCQMLLDEYFDLYGHDGTRAMRNLVGRKKHADFVAGKERYLKRATLFPREHVEGLGEVGRMYKTSAFENRVVLSVEEAAKYTNVWFKDDEKRLEEKSEEELKHLWNNRIAGAASNPK